MPLTPRFRCWWVAAAVLASAAAASKTSGGASGEADEPLEERVEVSAAAPASEDVAAFATVIPAEDERRRGGDLADLLRRSPGVRIRDYGGLGSYATISVRASTAEQVTILVDGIPQNRALGGPVDLSAIPLALIDEVVVYRGFGPASAGLGGIGGVVDIRTRPAGEAAETNVDLLGGGVGTRRVAAHLSTAVTATGSLSVTSEWLQGDGDYGYLDTGELLFDPSDDTRRKRMNNDIESGVVQAAYSTRLRGGSRLDGSVRFHDRDRGVPGLIGAPAEQARHGDRRRAARVGWAGGGSGAVSRIDVVGDFASSRLQLRDPLGEFGRVLDRTTRLEGHGLTATARFAPPSGTALVRLETRRETARVRDAELKVSDRGGLDREQLLVTAERSWRRGSWTVAPSVRAELRSDDFRPSGDGAIDPAVGDVDEWEWAAKLGARLQMSDTASVRGSLGRFSRIPSLTELFGDRGALAGNPALRPEEGLALEAGYSVSPVRRDRHPWNGEAVLFVRHTDDLITFLPTTPGQAVAVNLAESETLGLELAGGAHLAESWSFDASATWQRARDASGGFSDGERLPYHPELLGYLAVAWTPGRWEVRWEAGYQSDSATDSLDTPRLRLPGRTIHDASFEWRSPGGLVTGIELRNATDVETVDLLRYPLPGRVWLARVSWRSEPAS